jgi:hypothetical protein
MYAIYIITNSLNGMQYAFNDPAWKAAQSARVKAIWAIRKAQKETV